MLRKSRTRAMQALIGSAMLLSLPLATGCQSANFGGNVPGFGWVSGWWGGDAAKADPNKPPAGYLPSSKADPNGSSYAGGAGRGRTARDGYGAESAGGYEPKTGSQGASYASGNRNSPNNWGGATRQTGASSSVNDSEGDYAGSASKGYGAGASTRGDRYSGGNDPYGGSSPSTGDDSYASSARGSAYSADTRNASVARGAGGYSSKMTSGSQRATRERAEEETDYGGEDETPSNTSGSRFSSGGYGDAPAATTRGGRSAKVTDEDSEEGAMTADEDAEPVYPQTTGYGSSYKVPQTRSSATPASERRYPSTKSGGASKTLNDDYGMTEETEQSSEVDEEVQQVAATETGRYGLSSKAAGMLDRSSDGEFRPGTTGRPGYSRRSNVSQAGYADGDAAESTASRSTSRFAE